MDINIKWKGKLIKKNVLKVKYLNYVHFGFNHWFCNMNAVKKEEGGIENKRPPPPPHQIEPAVGSTWKISKFHPFLEKLALTNWYSKPYSSLSHTQTKSRRGGGGGQLPPPPWCHPCLYAVKVKRHNVVRGGPLSWIPGMWFTLCKFRL